MKLLPVPSLALRSPALLAGLILVAGLLAPSASRADGPPSPAARRVVVLAGKKSHGPEGNGLHDYGWSARLLKVLLDHSNVKDRVRTEVHLNGWPADETSIEGADTLVVISDGRDGDKYAEALHLENDGRVAFVEKQMKRGCGLVTFHFSTFAPQKYAPQVLRWTGGYFQWETDGKRRWYSDIKTIEAELKPASPGHPVSRGVKPFSMKEEFYFNLRFDPRDEGLTPLWAAAALPGREPDGRVVAWAKQRGPDDGGGRGFGTTAGHFFDNWKHDDFRKLVLNAVAWTAGAEVPPGGVEAPFYDRDAIRAAEKEGGNAK